MLQIVLKSYNYYEGKIDGDIGPVSKTALKEFQSKNNLVVDGILGPNTCLHLLNRNNIVNNTSEKNDTAISINNVNIYSLEVEENQQILKSLGLYTGIIDGINGPSTKSAVKEFQSKSGLVSDGVVGKKTKKALEQGEAAYIPEETENLNITEVINVPNTPNTSSTSSALDLRNYNPKLNCSAG